MLDLDRDVTGDLLLRTVPGAVDYLAEELRGLETVAVTSRRRDGVVVALDGSLRELAAVRYFMSAAVVLRGEPDDALFGSHREGVLSALDAAPRFRVADIGQDRWRLRDTLEASGWINDPSGWDINITTDDGLFAEIGQLYWTKRFGEMERAPASTQPQIATVMTRLAKIAPGDVVLDPMCGAGSLLLSAAAMSQPGRLLGSDHDARWVAATARNSPPSVETLLWQGDARALPLPADSVNRVLANLPFGKRVGSHIGNQRLYPAILGEIARVMTRKGRAVLLTEDKNLFVDSVQRTRGIRVIKQITFESGGAHPSAYVVTTRRTR